MTAAMPAAISVAISAAIAAAMASAMLAAMSAAIAAAIAVVAMHEKEQEFEVANAAALVELESTVVMAGCNAC